MPDIEFYFSSEMLKRPKLYLRDSGLIHALLPIETPEQLHASPRLGASWEGFALECVCRTLGKEDGDLYFWNTPAGAELDLYWQARGQNWGVEFKYEDAPRLTRSLRTAVEDLKLERLWIVYPGKDFGVIVNPKEESIA
jgi:uncharacterized protein